MKYKKEFYRCPPSIASSVLPNSLCSLQLLFLAIYSKNVIFVPCVMTMKFIVIKVKKLKNIFLIKTSSLSNFLIYDIKIDKEHAI